MSNGVSHEEALRLWNRAHRQAFWEKFKSNFQGKSSTIIDFNEVSHRLHLKTSIYRGVQSIPLDKIVGSVGRYQDFAGTFLPLNENMGERWRRILMINMQVTGGGLPPIEALKVGDWYFVKDGNHRVSVARQMHMPDIEGYVWEYQIDLTLPFDQENIEAVLLEAERRDFLTETEIDTLVPNHNIKLSSPGGYTELLCQIAHFQYALSQIDNIETSYEEAVKAWYEIIYETSVQIIEQSGILNAFPERTLTDFYVWSMQHHKEMESRYGKRVGIETATIQFRKEHPRSFVGKLWRAVNHLLANDRD